MVSKLLGNDSRLWYNFMFYTTNLFRIETRRKWVNRVYLYPSRLYLLFFLIMSIHINNSFVLHSRFYTSIAYSNFSTIFKNSNTFSFTTESVVPLNTWLLYYHSQIQYQKSKCKQLSTTKFIEWKQNKHVMNCSSFPLCIVYSVHKFLFLAFTSNYIYVSFKHVGITLIYFCFTKKIKYCCFILVIEHTLFLQYLLIPC